MFRIYAVMAIPACALEGVPSVPQGEEDVSTTTTAAPTDYYFERFLTANGTNVSTPSPTAPPTPNPTAPPATPAPTTATPTPIPTPAPTVDMVCDDWKDANTWPALTLPEAWGGELPVHNCLADWIAANPDRNAAFPQPGKRLLGEVHLDEIDGDEPDVVTTTTAEPTMESWSEEQRAKQEFLSAYRVLSSGNDTNV